MMTLLGAALKYNGLSHEQGYLYYSSSIGCADSSSSVTPEDKPRSTSSHTLRTRGLHSLVIKLLGGADAHASPAPSTPGTSYILDARKFCRLILSASLDPQV
jgi:hypothetical protein